MCFVLVLHDPSVCVFMYGQATESRWVKFYVFLWVMMMGGGDEK